MDTRASRGYSLLFCMYYHVSKDRNLVASQVASFRTDQSTANGFVKDTSLPTSTILRALHACITNSTIFPSWIASDDVDISKIWCYAITDSSIVLDGRLDGRVQNSPTFSDLQRDGQVVLCPLRNFVIGKDYRVTFPLIFLKTIIPKERVPPRSLIPKDCGPLYRKRLKNLMGRGYSSGSRLSKMRPGTVSR